MTTWFMASNLRWCSDGLEIVCWNGEKVRIALIIDAFDREVVAHVAVAVAGISGSDVRDMMLAAVERRFGTDRAPCPVEHLSDNGRGSHRQGYARLRYRSRPRSPASRLSDHRRAMA